MFPARRLFEAVRCDSAPGFLSQFLPQRRARQIIQLFHAKNLKCSQELLLDDGAIEPVPQIPLSGGAFPAFGQGAAEKRDGFLEAVGANR